MVLNKTVAVPNKSWVNIRSKLRLSKADPTRLPTRTQHKFQWIWVVISNLLIKWVEMINPFN